MVRKVCDIVSIVLIMVLLFLAVILIVPKFLGCETLAVISGSMHPKIPVGSIVIVREEDPAELGIGDIATYRMNDHTFVTHRVLENHVDTQYIIFKGDANEAADANPIAYADVEGKVLFHFPMIGYLSIYMKTPLGIAAVCGIVFVLLLLAFLPEIFEPEDKKETVYDPGVTNGLYGNKVK